MFSFYKQILNWMKCSLKANNNKKKALGSLRKYQSFQIIVKLSPKFRSKLNWVSRKIVLQTRQYNVESYYR